MKEKKKKKEEKVDAKVKKKSDSDNSSPSPQTEMKKTDPTDKIAELEARIKALEEGMVQTLQALQNINKFFEQIQAKEKVENVENVEATATNNPIPQTQTQPMPIQFDLESLAPLLQFFLGGGKSELDKLKDKVFLRWLTRKTVYESLVDKMFLRFAKKMLSKEEFEELKKVFEEE